MTTLKQLCDNFHYDDSLRNLFHLRDVDTLIIQIVSPLSIICSIINIIFFIKVRNARQPPYDIILLVSIFSILNVIVYISTIIYDSVHPPGNSATVPDNFTDFCLGIGSLRLFAQIGIVTYNCVFCFYYVFKIRNPLKSWVKQNKQMHILCIVLTTLITGLIYLLNQVGISLLGICALKISKFTFFAELGISFFYFFTLTLSSVIFLKYLRKISKYDHRTKLFFKYYLIYTVVVSFCYIFESSALSVLIADCYLGLPQDILHTIISILNTLVLCLPIINTIIILFHPQVKKGVIPNLMRNFKRKKNEKQTRNSFYDDLLTTTSRNTVEIQMMDLNKMDEDGYLSHLKERNRVSLLVTILGSIYIQEEELGRAKNQQMREQEEHLQISPWNMMDKYQLNINQDIYRYYNNVFIETIPVVLIRFISYAPNLFKNLLYLDKVQYPELSLNPQSNLQKIYSNAQADGGKSGQFFFFTNDNRFILKTITEVQLKVLLERLQDYHEHFIHEKDSLIVKIYGVFTTLNTETGQALHFMMMGNLLGTIHRKYVQRVYDLKGSTHHRQVFKKDEVDAEEYSKKTMKDLDFERLQKKIWIPKEESQIIKEQLRKDSFFFFQKGLIDYSLIVIKVDFNKYSLDMIGRQKKNDIYINMRTMIKSNKQAGIMYIFGIIDYLQTWNVKKKGEKWYKSLWTRSEGISSQNPQYYSQRFCENLVQKIFP